MGVGVAMLCVTGALLAVANKQNQLHTQQQRHFRRTERAYVTVSPQQPGLVFLNPPLADAPVRWTASLKITNSGNTPARVLQYWMTLWITDQPLPGLAPAPKGTETSVDTLLVKNDSFYAAATPALIDASEYDSVKAGSAQAYLYGFVRYEDQFGGLHRRWFLRQYNPAIDSDAWQQVMLAGGDEFHKRQNLNLPAVMNYNHEEDLTPSDNG